MPFGTYLELTDPNAIRALAHPARTAILYHLMEGGPATATECAEVVGESPSSCSYHLRRLAAFGFVEQVASEDRRERRWRALVTGYGIPKDVQDRPEVLAALRPLTRRWFEDNQKVVAEYLEQEPTFDLPWRKAATFTTSGPYLTPEQLIRLGEQVQALLEPYDGDPSKVPEGSMRVHVSFVAIPWPTTKKKRSTLPRKRPKGRNRGTD
jgi:DNA-binding transcriptional ArsR family regulator